MGLIALPKYVFRGTTIGYEGNKSSIALAYTCTSSHPAKALWFALECYIKFPEQSVVYVANTEKLGGLIINSNHFSDYENEFVFKIPPNEFCSLSMGYLHVSDLQIIMKNLGFEYHKLIRNDNLTRACKETLVLTVNEIETLVVALKPKLKNSNL